MKNLIITSRRWDATAEKLEEHQLTIKVSNTTAKQLVKDLESSPCSCFSSNSEYGKTDFSFDIRDAESGLYEFQAVRM